MNKHAILLFAAALGIVLPIGPVKAQETSVPLKDTRWDIVING